MNQRTAKLLRRVVTVTGGSNAGPLKAHWLRTARSERARTRLALIRNLVAVAQVTPLPSRAVARRAAVEAHNAAYVPPSRLPKGYEGVYLESWAGAGTPDWMGVSS